MEQNFYTQLQFIRKFGDYIILNIAFMLGYLIKFGWGFEVFTSNNYLSFLLFFNLSWILSTGLIGSYSASQTSLTFLNTLDGIIRLIFLHLLFVAAFNGVIKTYFSRLFILYSYVSLTSLVFIWRYVSLRILVWQKQKNHIQNRILLLGVSITEAELLDYFSFFKKHRLIHVEKISVDWEKLDQPKLIDKLLEELESLNFSEVFVSASRLGEKGITAVVDYAEKKLKRIHFVIDDPALNVKHLELTRYNQTPVINVKLSPLDYFSNQLIKRLFDVLFSILVIVFILSWLYPLLFIVIKINSKGPVFFKQLRTGINNQPFVCYKFRTMALNEHSDRLQATPDDPRITSIGQFLRRSSIDELPQFFNVLIGEMSVVGPRPHMLKHTEEYAREIGSFMQRHAIKPGITGLAQAKGYRGEIRSLALLKNRVKLDRFYVDNWSLNLDLKIILLTIRNVFKTHD